MQTGLHTVLELPYYPSLPGKREADQNGERKTDGGAEMTWERYKKKKIKELQEKWTMKQERGKREKTCVYNLSKRKMEEPVRAAPDQLSSSTIVLSRLKCLRRTRGKTNHSDERQHITWDIKERQHILQTNVDLQY